MAAAASASAALPVCCRVRNPRKAAPARPQAAQKPAELPFPLKLPLPKLQQTAAGAVRGLLNTFVDRVFRFSDQPWLPSQSNFAPVDEISEAITLTEIEGEIPHDFEEGVYVRIGSNPLFGALVSTSSIFGESSESWVEGEGMIHAIYFKKNAEREWTITYQNKYVESETFNIEKEKQRPVFLPAAEGDPATILASAFLNKFRFGKLYKDLSNTNIFEHAGKYYAIAENHLPQEINILTLETYGSWNINEEWHRPFMAHPKKAPKTGELVFLGVDGMKPFHVLGIISADGKELVHKVDLQFTRCSFCHDIGVTERYNIILDMPLILDVSRVIKGGALFKFEKDCYARIGVMPRYGNAHSVKWFEVDPCCVFHTLNCYEDKDEVVVHAFSANGSIIPGPELGKNKFEWFSEGFKNKKTNQGKSDKNIEEPLFFSRLHEWRLNVKTGEATERYLTGQESSMEFPMVNEKFLGLRNRYGYAQVGDLAASSICAKPKFGSLVKLYLDNQDMRMPQWKGQEGHINTEYYHMEKYHYCSGAAFVSKQGSHCEEDDGWVISFVHNEDANTSEVHIINCKRFSSGPVARIKLPTRVPYGFHGAFFHKPSVT